MKSQQERGADGFKVRTWGTLLIKAGTTDKKPNSLEKEQRRAITNSAKAQAIDEAYIKRLRQ
jgi:hypothetical protein